MGNVYQNYSFSWYNVIELEEIEPVTITPADITIYTGGESYDSVVNGSGNEIGAVNNGLPTPGFYIDLPESVNAWLLEHVDKENIITTESGKQIVDLSKFLTTARRMIGLFTVLSLLSWRIRKSRSGCSLRMKMACS